MSMPAERTELEAKPGCCEEASTLSNAFYIPCNRPATKIILAQQGPTKGIEFRMCHACADHNIRNRGMKFVRAFVAEVDQFDAWRTALATGKPVEYTRGSPSAGYYKRKRRISATDRTVIYDAVAIRFEDGEWECRVTGGPVPKDADQIEELFVSVNSSPISYVLFETIKKGGTWPEDVKPIEPANADLPPHEAAAAYLKAQQGAAKAWLTELGHKPQTQTEADKAANYAAEFAKIENRVIALHKVEKQPHLDAGRDVDGRWFPTRDAAKTAKAWAKSLSDDYAVAESARRQREVDAINAENLRKFGEQQAQERERIANEERLKAKGVQVPEMARAPVEAPKVVVAETVKIGTTGRRQSLKTIATYEITDAAAILRWMAERNERSFEFLEAVLKEAKRLAEMGLKPEGLKIGQAEKMV